MQSYSSYCNISTTFGLRDGSIFREEYLLDALRARLDSVNTNNFQVLSVEPYQKDGGVFVRFSYSASDQDTALSSIESDLTEEANKHGGLPSWFGLERGNIWLVKGIPWLEDMNRYASPIVKVIFEGPDVQEQALYKLFRPYGRIRDVTPPSPVTGGTLRSSQIVFHRLHSATVARNVLHGLKVSPSFEGVYVDNVNKTRLRTAYQRPVQAHAIRDWMSSHPKILLPLLAFLLGALTYTIFDPIRSFMVQGKMMDWFYEGIPLSSCFVLSTLTSA
ncbi:hypothetical protein H0H81_008336 [Sphagnurus paluster]|uniref:Mitochondrial escape protein 2 n=1 Tax=Sphagnurus paluster TaxID=117069 RepID=A0A9P7KJ15_9AGAR|nr:hypothetical protein H0H81_008336 [Sphagnurus paluster]